MDKMRINNYRMAAYAALAVGFINLRYQTGSQANLSKSLVLIIPGFFFLGLTFTDFGKNFLQKKVVVISTSIVGALLLIYSFVV
jgi:undecaprenyl pyrophosphate phosphatase UppP